jgi:2-methylisocitrate lyase-like PEP mutase family enzyme
LVKFMNTISLKSLISAPNIVVAPGIYDAFSASMVERSGFNVAYLSGANIAYSRFGRPDIGLVSMTEVADTLSNIRERIKIPIIIDGDTGFGNALNVQRTIRLFERCGANAIQLEDQSMPKRCGHLAGKSLVSVGEAVGKIHAAVDSRKSDDTLIIARTDAIAVEGFEPALERAERYLEAGADILFIEAPESIGQIQKVTSRFKGRVPLLANMVEGGATPMQPVNDLQKLGYALAIFPGGIVRARARMEQNYYNSLKKHGWNKPFSDQMLTFTELNELLETDEILTAGSRYDGSNFEAKND